MRILGLLPEEPFDTRSWSGSAAPFFSALQAAQALKEAHKVALSNDTIEKLRVFTYPLSRWKERYHASVPRFEKLTRKAAEIIGNCPYADSVLQIGAWFSSAAACNLPCFSYHDGNAAQWYRYYGRGLLSEGEKNRHLNWEHGVYANMTGIFVMSSWLADSFVKDFGMPPSKVHVVGAGMNMQLPEVPRRDFQKPRFLFVGKDFERKGGKYLLEAFHKARKEIEIEMVIVGPQLNLDEPGLILPGFLSKSDPMQHARLKELFTSATAVVLPSIYEPFGISLTEGMAYGLPCITVDRCAMPEIVQHNKTGIVVDAEDSDALAAAMIDLARSPEKCAAFGQAGRQRAEANFTWNAVVTKITEILRDQYLLSN